MKFQNFITLPDELKYKLFGNLLLEIYQFNVHFDLFKIKNPSEALQLTGVTENGHVIKFIKNPSEKVMIIAVTNYPNAIYYIKNPSEKVMIIAVTKDPKSIQFIKNPSEKVMIIAERS